MDVCLFDFSAICFLEWTGPVGRNTAELVRQIHLKRRWHRLPEPETLQALELREGAVEGPLETAFVALQPISNFLPRDERCGGLQPIVYAPEQK